MLSPFTGQPEIRARFAGDGRKRLHHAYLLLGHDVLHGERIARSLAAALLCSDPSADEPCGACDRCRRVESGSHPDVLVIAPNDKGAISVDDVRAATARLSMTASDAPLKVCIISRAEAMNPAAQNALLKTLEEPPGDACILLVTSRLRALLPTIRSRTISARILPRPVAELGDELGELSETERRLVLSLTGGDPERAQALVSLGFRDVVEALTTLLSGTSGETSHGTFRPADALSFAADWGRERDKAELVLAVIEVLLRDALAHRHGAAPEHRLLPTLPPALRRAPLAELGATLTQLRRYQANNLNRTLVVERLLLGMTETSGPDTSPRP